MSYVHAAFNVDCEWEGINPVYRIYVNDELFAERTWRWTEFFLTENIRVEGPTGRYQVRLEPVGPQIAKFTVDEYKVVKGPGRWVEEGILEITDESQ